jgi:hypothetical protein
VHALLDAEDRDAEARREAVGVAVVVAVGEHDAVEVAALEEPEAVLGLHRVEHRRDGLDVVGADRRPDVLVERGPVPEAGSDLVHGARG